MAGLYALAQRTTQTASNNAAWEVRAPVASKVTMMELSLSQVTAVAGTYGVGRPAAIGVNPTSPQTFVDDGDGGTVHGTYGTVAGTTAAVAWTTTAPTVPASFNRRYTVAAAIGQGFYIGWPRGLGIPASSSIVVWNLATAPVCDVSAVVAE